MRLNRSAPSLARGLVHANFRPLLLQRLLFQSELRNACAWMAPGIGPPCPNGALPAALRATADSLDQEQAQNKRPARLHHPSPTVNRRTQ